MGRCGLIFAVVAATCLAIGCGSTAVENPVAPSSITPSPTPSPSASPSPQFPSLLGSWRSSGLLELTRADGSSIGVGKYVCVSFWDVHSQDGGDFSGAVSITGNGRNSDRMCGYSGKFRGTMTADGAVTIRLDPVWANEGCSRIAGDGTFTGGTQPDGSIVIATSAAATCGDDFDKREDGTRTVTFSWTRPRP
jgi:hypothetical protein